MPSAPLAFKTVLLKVSGEGLGDADGCGVGTERLDALVVELGKVVAAGARVGIVVGGGNFVRGATLEACGLDRAACDSVGMLATVMNGILLNERLTAAGVPVRHLVAAGQVAGLPAANAANARAALAEGRVVIFSGGTGSPFFTTDTAGALRARELGAEAMIKATKVDGVYDADPLIHPAARRFDSLAYEDVLERKLRIIDAAAISLAMEVMLPIIVCDLFVADNLVKLVKGERVGTRIGPR